MLRQLIVALTLLVLATSFASASEAVTSEFQDSDIGGTWIVTFMSSVGAKQSIVRCGIEVQEGGGPFTSSVSCNEYSGENGTVSDLFLHHGKLKVSSSGGVSGFFYFGVNGGIKMGKSTMESTNACPGNRYRLKA